MNTEIKEQWIKALESDEYKQGKDALRHLNDTYCCLGVLCDLHSKATKTEWESYDGCSTGGYTYLHSSGTLPAEVMQWSGLDSRDPSIGQLVTATVANDSGWGFKRIAAMIRANA